jgi:hypothetical protein
MCDYRRGLDWWLDLLTTYTHDSELRNYSAVANLSNLQITPANTKSSPASSVFAGRFLVTDVNSLVSSASRAEVLPSQTPVQNCLLSQSQSCVTTDGQSASLRVKPPSGAQDQIFITVRQLRLCWYGEPYLTRGRVCSLPLLLVFASAVILRYESRGTHGHILLSQIPDSPNQQGQVLYLYPRNRVAQL